MSRSCRLTALTAVVLILVAVCVPMTAHAAERVWVEGTAERPLSVGSLSDAITGLVRGAPGAVLKRGIVWEYRRPGSEPFDPFSVELLGNGNVLIASRTNEVLEVDRRKRIVWSYTRADDDPNLVNTYSAQRLPNGNTLITDRRADFVIEVTPAKEIVWRYGAARDTLAPGSLVDPFFAQRLPNGNTLIADNRGATRVIEVRSSDYDPDAPGLGFTADSIVWQYGRDDDGGTGPGQLASPRQATRLANGNTLIVDAADQVFPGHRVIEVTPGGQIVWQFGTPGEMGSDETHLNNPSSAQRLANGNTVIVEEDGARLIEVDPAGGIVDWYGAGELTAENGELVKARAAFRTPSGTTLIAEQGSERVIEIGYPVTGTVASQALTLGLPGVKKSIARIELATELPEGTSVALAYSLDGGAWVQASGSAVALQAGTTATQLRYRLTLETSAPARTPVVRSVRVTYDVVVEDTDTPGGGTGDDDDDDAATGGSTSGRGSGTRGTGQGTIAGGSKLGSGLGGTLSTEGDAGVLPGSGTGGAGGLRTQFARGTLLDVIPLSGPEGVGLGALGARAGTDAIALGLIVLGLAYATGVAGGPAVSLARAATRYTRTRLGRSST